MPSYQENREEIRDRVVHLREMGFTWGDIAVEMGFKSPGTSRNIYKEAGLDPHIDLNGNTTQKFEEGDWCTTECIASTPQAKCNCRCGRSNHAGGTMRALEILSAQGLDQDEIDRRVLEVEKLQITQI